MNASKILRRVLSVADILEARGDAIRSSCIQMQRQQAGNAIVAPIMSLVAIYRPLSIKLIQASRQTRQLTDIAPNWNHFYGVVAPNDSIDAINDVRDKEPRNESKS